MDSASQRRLIEAVANSVIHHADELTALDQAIGDGDHGLNMKRGAMAILEQLDALAAKPLPEALKASGQTLVNEGRRCLGTTLRDAAHGVGQGPSDGAESERPGAGRWYRH
jgi:dihydroxyacetone kinase-like protein